LGQAEAKGAWGLPTSATEKAKGAPNCGGGAEASMEALLELAAEMFAAGATESMILKRITT
jgi:hypothetical protein